MQPSSRVQGLDLLVACVQVMTIWNTCDVVLVVTVVTSPILVDTEGTVATSAVLLDSSCHFRPRRRPSKDEHRQNRALSRCGVVRFRDVS
jgi:hypothetical protein